MVHVDEVVEVIGPEFCPVGLDCDTGAACRRLEDNHLFRRTTVKDVEFARPLRLCGLLDALHPSVC
ncbi:MAG: hypothetical protein A2341_12115 [Deltaproteobacteria bacterium RIFOXYB12_FULL_58_9]|nr:MAG: hypothetical protein A2341_12115 [Deltaproteobacteria bacterium RIFOXYB12_FULL_58_9]